MVEVVHVTEVAAYNDPYAAAATAELALHNSHEWRSAGRIVKHLWTIFVLLPVVLGILFALLTAKW